MMTASKFQLHHTGIKTTLANSVRKLWNIFQLHHTGIKTPSLKSVTTLSASFQLHHTGIKTACYLEYYCFVRHFNCTIQELKRKLSVLLAER